MRPDPERTGTPAGEPRANGAPPRPRTDTMLRLLGRILLSVYYSETEVIGLENIPKSGGAIVVGNHSNSLIDAVTMVAILPRMPRFLAASTVWDHKTVVPFLKAAGVVPLYRRQDGRQGDGDTAASLEAAAGLLGAGGVLAVFPEGKSHNEAALLPMKSGTARIALQAEHDHGPLGLQIIPVGITFESKHVFRSRVMIEIGAPVDVRSEEGGPGTETACTPVAKALTAQISEGLAAVTPNYRSWDEAVLIEQAADIWLQTHTNSSGPTGIRETAQMRKQFRLGYAVLRKTHGDLIGRIGTELALYVRLLNESGLRDEQVEAAQAHRAMRLAGLKGLGAVALRLPLTLPGIAINGLPFWLLQWLSRRQDLDKRATWSVFAGLILFPVFWLLFAAIAATLVTTHYGAAAGFAAAGAVMIAGPVTGLVAIKSRELRQRAMRNLRAWYLLRRPNDKAARLIAQRRSVLGLLFDLWDSSFGKAG